MEPMASILSDIDSASSSAQGDQNLIPAPPNIGDPPSFKTAV